MQPANRGIVIVRLAAVAGVLLALGPAVAQAQATGWDWENLLPQGNPLSSVWGSSGTDVYAVGGYPYFGMGLVLHYDGADWHEAGWGGVFLQGVWGSGRSDVYAVGGHDGNGNVVYFDGEQWSARDSGTANTLRSAWGSREAGVFATGWGGTSCILPPCAIWSTYP